MKSPRRPADRTCGTCKWCYEKDAFEMDGLCEKQCSCQENRNYTFLDTPGCRNWEIAETIDNRSEPLTK